MYSVLASTQTETANDDTVDAYSTYFSLSPSHLDMRSDEDTLKNVELLASVATALAKYDLPVPGGCKSKHDESSN